MSRNTTLKEVAQVTGLSVSTVSHILAGRVQKYGADTRERVEKAAAALHYRPNSGARAIRTGKFNTIALFLSRTSELSNVTNELLLGIEEELEKENLCLTITRFDEEQLAEDTFLPRMLSEYMVDGLLINYHYDVPGRYRLEQLLTEYSVPSAWINIKKDKDCVYLDDEGIARSVTERLLGMGHRRIAYVDYTCCPHYSSFDRVHGYELAMRSAGLTPRIIRERVKRENRHAHILSWLSKKDRPTAVIGYSHSTILPVLFCAVAQCRLRIPEDLSLMTFDGEAECSVAGLKITSAIVPQRELGKAAVRAVISRLRSPEMLVAPQIIPMQIVDGETLAVPCS